MDATKKLTQYMNLFSVSLLPVKAGSKKGWHAFLCVKILKLLWQQNGGLTYQMSYVLCFVN
jgi:hypothetical protein